MSLNGDTKLTASSPNPNCPACAERRLHTATEWRLHPLKGHGYAPECGGWTHESLKGAK